MNNNEIGAAFVAMVNGTKTAKDINGRNNLSVTAREQANGQTELKLWSYGTVIAHYVGGVLIINETSYSNSTAKHQNTINGLYCSAPYCRVRGCGWYDKDLTRYNVGGNRYTVEAREATAKNGRKFTNYAVFDSLNKYDIFRGTQAKAEAIAEDLNDRQTVKA